MEKALEWIGGEADTLGRSQVGWWLANNYPGEARLGSIEGHFQLIISEAIKRYESTFQSRDRQALQYFRGEAWDEDYATEAERSHRSQLNRIFPIADTIASALAEDTPQVKPAVTDLSTVEPVTPADDKVLLGRRQVAPLNYYAKEGALEETVYEAIIHALSFYSGGVVKVTWSAPKRMVDVVLFSPDELFWDPLARKWDDIRWLFQKFTLPASEVAALVRSGKYRPVADVWTTPMPEGLVQQDLATEGDHIREGTYGVEEFLTLVEFWDFAGGMRYHVDPKTGRVLHAVADDRRPFHQLRFNPGLIGTRGIPTVGMLVKLQEELDLMVSARATAAQTMNPRGIGNANIIPDPEQQAQMARQKPWEITWLPMPPGTSEADLVKWIRSPGMAPEFHNHLEKVSNQMDYQAGVFEFTRGMPTNVRTASEVNHLVSTVTGRLTKSVAKIQKFVRGIFKSMYEELRWAITNQDESEIDLDELYYVLQIPREVPMDQWVQEVLNLVPQLEVLPFGPLQQKGDALRMSLANLLPVLVNPQIAPHINWGELVKDIQMAFEFRPSILATPAPVSPMGGIDASLGQAGVPGMDGPFPPEGMPPEGAMPSGGIPPEMMNMLGGMMPPQE